MYEPFKPFFQHVYASLVKHGDIPRHVAFVADGARRFGQKNSIPVQENHEIGLFGVMWAVIDWCVLLGVREYSILMYSFGNYYRPKDEVQHWIVVLKIWLLKSIVNWKTLESKGIRFNFYGKFELIPKEINALMGILHLITKNNTNLIVNMAMGYTGKHEMYSVSYHLYQAINKGLINRDHLTEGLFHESLFAVENRNVDLLIRTSGYNRISDFLSWQISTGIIYFSDVLWPQFSLMDFLKAIIYFQKHKKPVLAAVNVFENDADSFLRRSKNEKRWYLLKYCHQTGILPSSDLNEIYSYDYETLYRYFAAKYNFNE